MFTVRNTGCNSTHYEGFSVNNDRACGDYTLMYAKTKARFTVDGEDIVIDAGTVIIFEKDLHRAYVNVDDTYDIYIDDWLHFDSTDPIEEGLINRFIHLGGAVRIDHYIRLICDAHFRGAGDIVTSRLIGVMLDDIRSASDKKNGSLGTISPLLELRKKIYANPSFSWTVEYMARSIMMSAPYFQSRYKNAFGISPVADVINIRIETAKAMLGGTELSISEIAEKCGYKSNVYFSRQFHTVVGMPPTQYRAEALRRRIQ